MRQNSLVRFLTNNLGWMAGSLALALVVWIAANMAQNPVEQRQIESQPVKILLPEGYVLTGQISYFADAVIRTQASDWDLLLPEDITITADLTDVSKPGSYRVELEADIAEPLHGRVVALRPPTLTLEVDYQTEKRVPVVVEVAQQPPVGYTYPPDLTCDQTEVTVRGSAEKVEMVDKVEVRLVLSDDLNPVIKNNQPLIPVQLNGRRVTGNITLIPETVNCPVDIQVRSDVFQVSVLPDVLPLPALGYLFEGYTFEPQSVVLTGDRFAIQALGGVIRTQPIDPSGHTSTFTTEVALDLPDGVSLIPENQLVTVTVTITAVRSTRQYEDVPVEITGLDPTVYNATLLPSTVTVFIAGPEVELPELEDLRVTVDLSELAAGNHQVQPQGAIRNQGSDSADMIITIRPEVLSVTIESLFPTPMPSPTPSTTPENNARPANGISNPTPTSASSSGS